jgi:Protein  of unknown function (DUF3018)
MGKHEILSGAQRVARRRQKLRMQGLRLRQYWLPDLRDATVLSKIHSDVAKLAGQGDRWLNEYAFAIGAGEELLQSLPEYPLTDDEEANHL